MTLWNSTKGDVRTIWIHSHVIYTSVIHSTWSSWAMWRTHAPTFNKWHQKKKKKKKTLHMLTHGAMRGCGLTSLVVCNNDKFHDIRERNVTTRSEIWTTNICSLGFRDIRECVTLWRLILRSLGCRWVWNNNFYQLARFYSNLKHAILSTWCIPNPNWGRSSFSRNFLELIWIFYSIPK